MEQHLQPLMSQSLEGYCGAPASSNEKEWLLEIDQLHAGGLTTLKTL